MCSKRHCTKCALLSIRQKGHGPALHCTANTHTQTGASARTQLNVSRQIVLKFNKMCAQLHLVNCGYCFAFNYEFVSSLIHEFSSCLFFGFFLFCWLVFVCLFSLCVEARLGLFFGRFITRLLLFLFFFFFGTLK